jgi:hypothetical protein
MPTPLPLPCFSFSLAARACHVSGRSPSFGLQAAGVGQALMAVENSFPSGPFPAWKPYGVGHSLTAASVSVVPSDRPLSVP